MEGLGLTENVKRCGLMGERRGGRKTNEGKMGNFEAGEISAE